VAISSSLDFSKRRDLLKSLARLRLSGENQKRFMTYIGELNGAAKERNTIIHGLFGADENGIDIRFNFKNRGVLVATSTPDNVGRIIGVARKIIEVANRMPQLIPGIRADLQKWPDKCAELGPPPWGTGGPPIEAN
jgi:hypothetical protein